MANALVGAVVHVGEERFPVVAQCGIIDSESMILACDEAAVGASHAYGLIVASVSILEFVGLCSTGLGKELVAHTYTEDRLVAQSHGSAQVVDSCSALVGVTWAVADEDAIVVQGGEVVVPRHTHYLHSTALEAAYDIALHAAVDEDDGLFSSLIVADDFFARDFVDVVDRRVWY